MRGSLFHFERRLCTFEDICVTFVVYACGKSIRNICLHSGEKKKTADGQIISHANPHS